MSRLAMSFLALCVCACVVEDEREEVPVGVARAALLDVTCSFGAMTADENPDTEPANPVDGDRIRIVDNPADLQTELDDLATTDDNAVLVIKNGTYNLSQSIVLPDRPSSHAKWITITGCDTARVNAYPDCPGHPSSGAAPTPGITGRFVASDASGDVPNFVVAGSLAAFRAEDGSSTTVSHHYIIVGVEVSASQTHDDNMISFARADTSEIHPHHIRLDRVFVHGTSTGNTKRGVLMNGNHMTVVRSRITDIHRAGAESQAIAAYNGSGPYTIKDNYLTASSEAVLFGGADTDSSNDMPGSIRIYQNHFHKPDAWRAQTFIEKNHLEFKMANGADVYQNFFDGSWADGSLGQNGFAILFTPRNQRISSSVTPDDTFAAVRNVEFRQNMVKRASGGIKILGSDDTEISDLASCITINDNIFDQIGGVTSSVSNAANTGFTSSFDEGGAPQAWIQIITGQDDDPDPNGASDITVMHNTARHTGNVLYIGYGENSPLEESKNEDFEFIHNVAFKNSGFEGLDGDGFANDGTSMLDHFHHDKSWVWLRNGFIGTSASHFPTGESEFDTMANVFPSSMFPEVKESSSFADPPCSHETALGARDVNSILSDVTAATDTEPL